MGDVHPHPAVGTIAIDFFTVPTVTFGVLYVFFVLSLERRRVIHVNVTEHPTAEWAAQQIVEAVGPDVEPRDLIGDGASDSSGQPARGLADRGGVTGEVGDG
jgi:hypothetical protein